jgi:hypothetical protein
MGPFPLKDDFGMLVAIAVLDRSLDPGNYEDYVQFETFRRARSAVTNGSQAGVFGLTSSVGAYEKTKLWISGVPTHSFWFSRFMTGVHKRVGDERRQDRAITIDVLHAVDKILELEWRRVKVNLNANLRTARKIAEMGVWFVCGYCLGIRGEEMGLIEFAGTAQSIPHLNDSYPYFSLMVTGRTKGNQISGFKFDLPCVAKTEGTGLRPGAWIKRLILIRREMKDVSGRLFQRQLRPPRLFEFEDDFFTLLERVQATTDLIENDCDVRDAYGIMRSIRKGTSAHCLNMNVGEDLLKAFNRWHKEATAGVMVPRLDMVGTYARSSAILPTLLRFSLAF